MCSINGGLGRKNSVPLVTNFPPNGILLAPSRGITVLRTRSHSTEMWTKPNQSCYSSPSLGAHKIHRLNAGRTSQTSFWKSLKWLPLWATSHIGQRYFQRTNTFICLLSSRTPQMDKTNSELNIKLPLKLARRLHITVRKAIIARSKPFF